MSGENMFWGFAGFVLGGVVTYFVTRKKFEDISNAEIEIVRKMYSEQHKGTSSKNDDAKETETDDKPASDSQDRKIVNDIMARQGYHTPYSSMYKKDDGNSTSSGGANIIEIVDPSSYDVPEEYAVIDILYYKKSEVLAYSTTGPHALTDIVSDKSIIGDALAHIGEYEENRVSVINHERHAYYEIEQLDEEFEADE